MKRYAKLIIVCAALLLMLAVGANLAILYAMPKNASGQHRVEINRLMDELKQKQVFIQPDLIAYKTVKGVEYLPVDSTSNEIEQFYRSDGTAFVIQPLFHSDTLTGYVRVTYDEKSADQTRGVFIVVNTVFAATFAALAGILIYLQMNIIKPFESVIDMPRRLARGQFSKPVQIAKGWYFEEFLWALDVLGESLATREKQQQDIEKNRKTLLLSLSHDIKTPLSTIALCTKALREGLYDDPDKQSSILCTIEQKTREIELYVRDLMRGTTEDMLSIDVQNSEFYLGDLMNQLRSGYKEKLELLQTELVTDQYPNAILLGDIDRTLEALGNVMENAIKYGDGKTVRIDFAREENCQLIRVKNGGVALSPEEVIHIFDAFWRGSNTKGQPGSGLGLYIARQILRKMDGDIFAAVKCDTLQITLVLNLAG